ncbi:MAG: hypothetical protein ABI808_11550 [Pseudonocardiales bacterium]
MFAREWHEAPATVIVAQNYQSQNENTSGRPSHSDLVLEIHPADQPSFRAQATIQMLGLHLDLHHYLPPQPGETVHVRFTDEHQVEVLLDDAHDRRVLERSQSDAFQAALQAPVGSGLGATATPDDPASIRVATADGLQDVPLSRADPALGGSAGILREGVQCHAIVLAAFPLGQQTSAGQDATGLVLEVSVPGEQPFQAQIGIYVPPEAAHLLTSGTVLPARAVQGDLNAVTIDWAAAAAG